MSGKVQELRRIGDDEAGAPSARAVGRAARDGEAFVEAVAVLLE